MWDGLENWVPPDPGVLGTQGSSATRVGPDPGALCPVTGGSDPGVPAPGLARLDSVGTHGSVLTRHPDLADATRAYVEAGRVRNTELAYMCDWRVFKGWCREREACPLPAGVETIAGFLSDLAPSRAIATLRRYRATISKAHHRAGLPSPAYDPRIREVLRGIARGARPPRTMAPTTADALEAMLGAIGGDSIRNLRDRAILLLGTASALRESEIVALDLDDLQWCEEGILVRLRRSKTDQAGVGRQVAVAAASPDRCPVQALRAWIDRAKVTQGALFRSLQRNGRPKAARLPAEEVAETVKRAARAAGLDPSRFAGHSLRAGYVTQARREGIDWATIMEQTGHRKVDTVMRYARDPIDVFRATRAKDVWRALKRG